MSPNQGDVDAIRLRLLYDITCSFAEHMELDELVPLVIERCREALFCEGASLLLFDAQAQELYFPYVAAGDEATADRLSRLRFPADQGIAGYVLRSGLATRVDDAERDPRVYRGADQETGTTTRSLLAAPLNSRHGPIGVLQVINFRGEGSFSADDLSFLEALAGGVAIAIDNARLYGAARESEQRLQTEVGSLRRDLARHDAFQEIVGTTTVMEEVFRLMESAAAAPVTVLLEGETGTGKELVARALHRAGPRADGPFITVNCAAIPESLLESELFGHRKGAFTGAHYDRVGFFEAATGGTIFLDEIGEMPVLMQAKLLRVLQEGEVVPLGDHRPRPIDVRVISATNRDLLAEVELENFREDLYYRVGTFPIYLPPLRDRVDDVLPIASRVLTQITARHGKKVDGFSAAAIERLQSYAWPGNVRELHNEIERATALVAAGEAIGPPHLSAKITADPREAHTRKGAGPAAADGAILRLESLPDSLRQARDFFERTFIKRTIERCDGNATRTAQVMGISRASLHNKLRDDADRS